MNTRRRPWRPQCAPHYLRALARIARVKGEGRRAAEIDARKEKV